MSRVTPIASADGTDRTSSIVNTVETDLQTASAAIDAENLAEEGLDIRNFNANLLQFAESTGNWPNYAEWTTDTNFDGAANYRAEPIFPIVMGTNVEIAFASTLTIGADEIMVIMGTIACGTSTDFALDTVNEEGVSAAIIIDPDNLGYDLQAHSRHGRKGRRVAATPSTYSDSIQADAFDLTPTLVLTNTTVRKIGLSLGLSGARIPLLRVRGAQIHWYIVKKVL